MQVNTEVLPIVGCERRRGIIVYELLEAFHCGGPVGVDISLDCDNASSPRLSRQGAGKSYSPSAHVQIWE